MRLVCPWLRELVPVPGEPESIAREFGLRGFEVAEIEDGRIPVIDFEITANRPDCLSHIGMAREASAIWALPLQMPAMAPPAAGPEPVGVTIEDAQLCPRYCAQVFDVDVAPSPRWLTERLEAAGVRPINNIVDVTNYVMLELGQPMHAFDLARLEGARLVIRRARGSERLRTLDGVERALDADVLVIADGGRPVAIGGVMGGQDSEIGSGTTTIVLESAYFDPLSVRRTSKRLGLKTEASIRFERGADIAAPPAGIARAAALFAQIGAGTPRGALIDRYPSPRSPAQVGLRAARIQRVLGQQVPEPDVPRILEPLGFRLTPATEGWSVTVPTFRADVSREIDLIEDVGRHYGFDRLPMTFPALTVPQPAPDPAVTRERLIRQILTAAGFFECVTFAFIERQAAAPFCPPDEELAAIANPLSEKFAVLRPSLLPGLVDACAHNRRRERKDVRVFESGSRFTRRGEGRAVAFAWTGSAVDPHWTSPARPVDFFDVKGVAEEICAAFGVRPAVAPSTRGFLIAGRSAELIIEREGGAASLGFVGQLLPSVVEARGFIAHGEPGEHAGIYAAEIDLEALTAVARTGEMRAQTLPRYPAIVRDISIVVDEALPAAAVRGTIRSAAPSTLASIVEFDRYRGKGVPEGRVSLSLRLTFRAPDRTLTDEEAQRATEGIVQALAAAHGAERR